MIKARNVILLACVSLIFGSCHKFSNGDVTTRTRQISEHFEIIEMYDNVDVKLRHSNADTIGGTIVITTGENLYENITTEIKETQKNVTHNGVTDSLVFNKLIVRNENTLDFLRPYDYPLEMTIYYDTLLELVFNSNGNIITDTLRGYNYWTDFSTSDGGTFDTLKSNLTIRVHGGSGNFDVLTNCFRLMTHYQYGTSKLTLRGQAVRAETYGDYDCHGVIDGYDLEAISYHQVTSLGTNMIIARAFHQIIARNENIGHIYYVKYRKKAKTIIWGHWEDGHHWVPNDTIDSLFYCPQSITKLGVYRDSITSIKDRP